MKLQILAVFSSSELGGAERSLTRMASINQSNIEYTLGTLDGYGPWVDWCYQHNIKPVIFGNRKHSTRHGRFGFRSIYRLVKYVRSTQCSVVYIVGMRASFWIRLVKPFLSGAKLVHGVRWNPSTSSRLDTAFLWLERILGFSIDHFICNSEAAASTVINRVGIIKEKVSVIYNGINSIQENCSDYLLRPMRVVILANLNLRKGHIDFLEVVSRICLKLPSVQFVFVGRDDMEGRLDEEIQRLKLTDFITITGYQSDVAPWLLSSRLMVLPSLWGEGCPTSILEGMAYNLPVVAYNIDGIPELIEDRIDGILVSLNDKSALADSILYMLNNPSLAEGMGKAGRTKVKDYFSLMHCSAEHASAFNKLVSVTF